MAEHIQRLFAAADSERFAQQILEARRLRADVFGPSLFSDPAWDLLLNLYLSELRHTEMTLDELADAIGLSADATGRWFHALAGKGMTREKTSAARDKVVIGLSATGASAMRRWFGLWLNGQCASDAEDKVSGLLDRLSNTDL